MLYACASGCSIWCCNRKCHISGRSAAAALGKAASSCSPFSTQYLRHSEQNPGPWLLFIGSVKPTGALITPCRTRKLCTLQTSLAQLGKSQKRDRLADVAGGDVLLSTKRTSREHRRCLCSWAAPAPSSGAVEPQVRAATRRAGLVRLDAAAALPPLPALPHRSPLPRRDIFPANSSASDLRSA